MISGRSSGNSVREAAVTKGSLWVEKGGVARVGVAVCGRCVKRADKRVIS